MPPFLINLLANKYVIGGFIIFSLSSGAYVYYLRTSAKIATLERDNQTLISAVNTQQQTIKTLEEDFKKVRASAEELETQKEAIKVSINNIKSTLYRELENNKKPLEKIAIKKTKLIEKKVNAATQKVLECFETLSKGGDC